MRDLNVLDGVGQEVNAEVRFVFFGEMQRLGFWRQTRNFANIWHAPDGTPTACGCLVACVVDLNACEMLVTEHPTPAHSGTTGSNAEVAYN
jgi:hypothetical protein